MIFESYALTVSVPLKSGARAAATFHLEANPAEPLSLPAIQELRKLLRTVEGELYVNIHKTTVDNDWKPA